MRTRNWDKETARQLAEEGKTNEEIAEAVGVNPNTVSSWRRKNGLSAAPGRRRAAQTIEEQSEPCAEAVTEAEKPVEIELARRITGGPSVRIGLVDGFPTLTIQGIDYSLLSRLLIVLDGYNAGGSDA